MEPSARAPWYDLFKLITAVGLSILFMSLVWRQAPQTRPLDLPASTDTAAAPTPTHSGQTQGEPVSVISSPTGTSTEPPTAAPPDTPTALATPTETLAILATATPVVQLPADKDICEAAVSRSRLQTGTNAAILRRLNFRSSPGIRDNWVLTNIPGTKVEIVGEPDCVPHYTGAYLWWQIKLPDGRIGWSAEASLHGSFYFMEPSP